MLTFNLQQDKQFVIKIETIQQWINGHFYGIIHPKPSEFSTLRLEKFMGVHGMFGVTKEILKVAKRSDTGVLYGPKLNKTKLTRLLENNPGSLAQNTIRMKYNEGMLHQCWVSFYRLIGILARSGDLKYKTKLIKLIYDAAFPNRRVMFQKSWRTSTVIGLAKGIWIDEAYDRMPILADALEEAGITNDETHGYLNYLRSENSVFSRGNWMLNRVLKLERY